MKHTEETKRKISESKKGNIPWNKGKRKIYSKEALKKMSDAKIGNRISKNTEFKKGHIPWNWKGGKDRYWGYKARKTLEENYGISWKDMHKPEKAVIHHIDQNRTNDSFNNLCVMTRSDHVRLHNEFRRGD